MNEQKYWTITDRPNIKTSEYLDEFRKILGEDMVYCSWSNDELDKLCPPPKEIEYTNFLASIFPDERHLGKSNDTFSKETIKFMSVRQGIILNLEVYKITGERLDTSGYITITSTLDSDGDAMSMYKNGDGKFDMGRGYRSYRYSAHGPREQFPLFPSLTSKPEIIKIGELEYNKEEIEKVLKNIKPLS